MLLSYFIKEVSMKAYGQITITCVSDGKPGEPSLNISIANENQNIPCTSDGKVIDNFLIEIPFAGYIGFEKSPCSVSVGILPSGITLGSNENATDKKDGRIILNVAKGSNLGSDQTVSGQILLTFTIKEREIVKVFTWSKTKDGATGSARIYILQASTLILKKTNGKDFNPNSITFSAFYKDGNSASLTKYNGRFIIEESNNGIQYESRYISQNDEASTVYIPSSKDLSSIKCTLYASGGVTKSLDFQTVTVLNDGSNINTGGVNLVEGTNQGDRNWRWEMESGDYTSESIVDNKINCAKLIRGSEQQIGWSFISYNNFIPSKYKPNETYTISFEVKSNVDTVMGAYFRNKDNSGEMCDKYIVLQNEIKKDVWNKCVYQATTKKVLHDLSSQILYLYGMNSKPNTYYIFKNLQIERGTVVTDWKPAPEDINEGMSVITTTVTELGAKVDNIKKEIDLKVSKTELTDAIDNYDKDRIQGIRNQVSDLNISVEGISGTVQDVQTTLSKKADGSTVQELSEKFTEFKQTSEGFQQTVEENYAKKSDLDEALKKNSTFAISLTNDDHTIPTDKNGDNGNYSGCETTVTAVFGSETVTSSCIFEKATSNGVTGSWNSKTYTYSVSNMSTDTGYVDITATYNVEINGKTEIKKSTKRFALSKRKDVVGEDAVVYTLQASDSIIKKISDTTFNPSKMTFSSYYRNGSSSQLPFKGIYKISESIDGSTYITQYISQVNESSKDYSPTSGKVQKIQCALYKDPTQKELLDIHTVTVISDSVDIGVRNLIRNSKTLIYASYGFVNTDNIIYISDENGNVLTDEKRK